MLTELKNLIDNFEIISFDMYDTLLFRPFMKPEDVFAYLGRLKNNKEFYTKRLSAETKARKNICNNEIQEITFNEIYNHIDDKFKNFKELEENFEAQILRPNLKMLDVYKYALSKNKKIIITSDMYFEEEFLSNILAKNGFIGFSKLYVSSKYRKAKWSGELYKIICDDLNVKPDKILHIGDNKNSDIKKASEIGINTYYFEQIKEQFIKNIENKRLVSFYNNNKNNVFTSMLLGLRIINWYNKQNDNYWQTFGYNYGGILVLAFIQAVISISKIRNISDIFFVARDGFVLNEIFKSMFDNCTKATKPHYIYASRKLRSLCINDDYKNCKYNRDSDKEYQKYINSINLQGNNILIVDTCALNYSAQTLLEKYLPDKTVIAVYLAACKNYTYNYINLFTKEFENPGFNWNIIELLLTSNEPQIVDIKNLNPVYLDNNNDNYPYELKRIESFNKTFEGEKAFVKDYLEIFKNYECDIDFKIIIEYFKNYYENLSAEDKNALRQIFHPADPEQKEYVPLYKEEINPLIAKLKANMQKSKEALNAK